MIMRMRGIALALLFLAPGAKGWAGAGTEGASFLDIPVGAGPAALGGAYSARALDAYAPVWNPAGLAYLESVEAAGMHAPYLMSTRYEFLSAVIPFFERTQGLGLSIQFLTSGAIDGRDDTGAPTGSYDVTMAAYSLAYGVQVGEQWGMGMTGKWITEKISDASAGAFASDLGLLYAPESDWRVALVAANLGSSLRLVSESDPLPQAYRASADWQPNPVWQLDGETVYRRSGMWSASAGVEFKYADQFRLRAGYDTSRTRELGAMAGLRGGFAVLFKGQEFSYAVAPFGDLGTSQVLSLVVRFSTSPRQDAPRADMSAKPERTFGEPSEAYENLNDILSDTERKSLWR